MNMYWRTAEGKVIYIPRMEDRHLKNCARFLIKKYVLGQKRCNSDISRLQEHPIFLEMEARGIKASDVRFDMTMQEMFGEDEDKEDTSYLCVFDD